MAEAKSYVSYALWGKESFPSANEISEPATTCDKFFWHLQGATPSDKNNKSYLRSCAGGRDYVAVVNGRYECSISVDSVLYPKAEALEIILGGTPSGSGTVTVAPANELSAFATEIGYKSASGTATKRLKYHGCKINSANISWSKGDVPVKISMDIQAQKPWTSDSVQTPTAPTGAPFTGQYVTVSVGGSQVTGIQDGNIGVIHNLVKQENCESRFIAGLTETNRDYSFDFKMYFKDDTEIKKFFGGTGSLAYPCLDSTVIESALVIVFTSPTGKTATLTFANFTIDDISTPLQIGDDLQVCDIKGHSKTLTNIVVVE